MDEIQNTTDDTLKTDSEIEQPATEEAGKPKKKKNRKIFRRIIVILWIFYLTMVTTIGLFFYGVSVDANGWFGGLPNIKELENPKSQYSSELWSADGVLIGKYFRSNRTPIHYQQISKNVINALIATEDVRFYEHSGIDMKGTFSIIAYLMKGKKRGASTITQQLAKNLFNTRSEELKGKWSDVSGLGTGISKAKEWLVAIQLERAYTKEEIMTMYLNTVDFGGNAFGIKVAAETFFGKDQSQLTIEEAATLVGLLKAPTKYGPTLNIQKIEDEGLTERKKQLKLMLNEGYIDKPLHDSLNKVRLTVFPPPNIEAYRRRGVVLGQMFKAGHVTAKDTSRMKKILIDLRDFNVESHNKGRAPYFRSVASEYLQEWCKKKGYDLYEDGLKIYSTIDSKMQEYAEAAVHEHMTDYQNKFFKHWKGKNPWVKEGAYRGLFKEIKGYLKREMKKGERWRTLKLKYDNDTTKMNEVLNTPRRMKVFSYGGEIDTVLSPYDSLRYYKHFLHAGFMSMNPKSGQIKAWVGGINFKHFKYDHVQQGKRQPGSTFKPFVYATVVGEADGVYSPCYKVVDAPVTFQVGEAGAAKSWTPKNADGKYSGDTLTLRQAMARSVNSITAFMMKIMGEQTPHMVVKYARNLGIESYLEPVPALCLGTFDVSVYEMVGAYSAFANEGQWTEPHFITRIEDRYGNLIEEFTPKRRNAINKETAYIMLHMLKGGTQEKGGTGLGLHKYGLLAYNEVGTKTGTTNNYSDGWFMGVTPQLVSGVWVGGDDKSIHFRSMDLGQGARMALPVWALYMKRVYADTTLGIKKQKFKKPRYELSVELDCDEYEQPEDEDEKNILKYPYNGSTDPEEDE